MIEKKAEKDKRKENEGNGSCISVEKVYYKNLYKKRRGNLVWT